MAKPKRYTRQDRLRKRIGLAFPLRITALLRHRVKLSQMHIHKAVLAAQALRRCTELEAQLEQVLDQLE